MLSRVAAPEAAKQHGTPAGNEGCQHHVQGEASFNVKASIGAAELQISSAVSEMDPGRLEAVPFPAEPVSRLSVAFLKCPCMVRRPAHACWAACWACRIWQGLSWGGGASPRLSLHSACLPPPQAAAWVVHDRLVRLCAWVCAMAKSRCSAASAGFIVS